MRTKAQKARLGLFITVSLSVLAIVIILISGSKLLSKWDTYYIAYKDTSVSGLEVGGAVKYHGIRIGKVASIKIDPKDVSQVIATINVEGGTPIKDDVEAITGMVGITGLKLIELVGGSNDAAPLKPGSFIKTGSSLADNISGKAEVIAEKFELLLNNLLDLTGGENKERFVALINNTNDALGQFNTVLRENTEPIGAAMKEVPDMIVRTSSVLEQLDSLFVNLNNVSGGISDADVGGMLKNMNGTLDEINRTFTHIDLTVVKGRKDIIFSLQLLKQTLQNVNEFSRLLAEDPSIIIRGIEQKPMEGR